MRGPPYRDLRIILGIFSLLTTAVFLTSRRVERFITKISFPHSPPQPRDRPNIA